MAYIKDYGAVGDGAVDDSDALERACAANRLVEFDEGKIYRITRPVYVGHKRILDGHWAELRYEGSGNEDVFVGKDNLITRFHLVGRYKSPQTVWTVLSIG